MNANESRTLWISVFAALGAVFLLYSYTQEKSQQLTKEFGRKQRVVVAKEDIQEMETITEDLLEIRELPTNYVQPSALKMPTDAVGLVALAPIRKDEQVLESKIMEPGPVTGLSLQVTPGKRAVTIPVDEVRGVGKLIKPGDRIDLLAALDVGKGASAQRKVKTILQDVPILATGLKIVNELPRLYEKVGEEDFIKNIRRDTSFTTVTIEASPQEAQNLVYILATSPGSLYMTLRHPTDHAQNRRITTDINRVLGRVSPSVVNKQLRTRQPAQAPPPAPKKKKKRPKKRGPFIEVQ
jgi:pilus assembly protein CpaB